MSPHIAVVGSMNMDLVVRTPRFPHPGETILGGPFTTHPGGKGANQAVAAARAGATVSMVACVGSDAYGHALRTGLARDGVNVDHVRVLETESSGVAIIAVSEAGENTIIVAPGANDALTPLDIDAAFPTLAAADVILVQLEISIETVEHVLRRADELRASIILNAAPPRALDPDLLLVPDVLVVNETEARELTKERSGHAPNTTEPRLLVENLPLGGHATGILTLGPRGAVSCTYGMDAPISEHPAFPVEVADTTAAGDAFCGALATALGEGREMNDAIRFASAAGAIAATRHGAQPSLPRRAEVERLLQRGVSSPATGSPG